MAGLPRWSTLVLALAGAACDPAPPAPSGEPPPPMSASGPAASATAGGGDAAAPAASAVTEVLRAVRARLDVEPALAPPQQLALTRRRLARLGPSGLTLVALPTGEEEARLALTEPRRVLALADDALVVATRGATWLVPAGARSAREHPRVTLFPGGFLLPWRGERHRIWVAPGLGESLLPWAPAADDTLPAALPLTGYRGGPLVALADGSLLAAGEGGLLRGYSTGKLVTAPTPRGLAAPWRLLAGRRADRAWSIGAAGQVSLIEVSATPRVLRTVALEGAPCDAASAGERLAVVTVRPGDDGRRWRVTVLDERGQERFTSALEGEPPADDDRWAGRLMQDREVVLDAEGRHLAVGGPGAVAVWELGAGRLLFKQGVAP